jgi:hypothetical protein
MARERSFVSSKGGVASLFLFLKDQQGYGFFAREIGLGFFYVSLYFCLSLCPLSIFSFFFAYG